MYQLKDGIQMGSLWPRSSREPRVGRSRLPTAGQIMSRRLITLHPHQTIQTALAKLTRARVSGAPVVDTQKQLLGIISEFDCIALISGAEFYQDVSIGSTTVQDVMTPAYHTIEATADLYQVCDTFVRTHVHRLPVLRDRRLVGILTRRDLARAIDRHWNTSR